VVLWVPDTTPASQGTQTGIINVLRVAVRQNSFLLIKDKQIRPIFFMYLLLTLGLNAFYEFFPVWLVEDHNYSSTDIAHATALQTLAMVLVSVLLVERLKAAIGIGPTIFLGLALLIISLASIHFLPDAAVMAYFLLTGSFIAIYNGLVPVLISDQFSGEKQGRLMGLLISTFSLAAVLIAPVGGVISLIGAKFSIIFGAFLLLCGAIYLKHILDNSVVNQLRTEQQDATNPGSA
jgi:predicted MFS family arabinose efflux permease